MARTSSTKKRSSTTARKRPRRRASSSRKKAGGRQARPLLGLNNQQRALIVGIFLIFITAIAILSLLSPNQGRLTEGFSNLLWYVFGWGGVIIPIGFALAGFYLVLWGMEQPPSLPHFRLFGVLFLFLTLEAFASMIWVAWNNGAVELLGAAKAGQGGGYIGSAIVWLFNKGVGNIGTVFILFVLGIVTAALAFGVSRQDAGQFVQRIKSFYDDLSKEEETPTPTPTKQIIPGLSQANRSINTPKPSTVPEPSPVIQTALASRRPSKKRRKTAAVSTTDQDIDSGGTSTPEPLFLSQANGQKWSLPDITNILESGDDVDIGDTYFREQVEIIEHTLDSFGAPATVVEINQGPTITQYGVEPSFIENRSGKRTKVKVGKIASLADDLALALAAQSIRIQAPVPGKGYVGIEVPNSQKALVSLRDVMESAPFAKIRSPLRVGLGQNVAGQAIAADLTQMPHLLIAGTTGSGKSVCVNSLIACLLLQNTPEDLKFVMVDPKRVELTGYNGIPHLAAPVVVDLERVVGTLKWAMREMDNRYSLLAEVGARNIVEYNKRIERNGREKLAYIVIIIDELADLMSLSPEETERGITRLAQMARATGIHMIIATQRPSVDVVTGLIKANFPARIAFKVPSGTDSRVILDNTGADRLLGQGDMLFQSPDASMPVRMQGCFVSDRELGKVIDYWQRERVANYRAREQGAAGQESQRPETEEIEQQPLWEEMQQEEEEAARYSDELLPDAIALVRQLKKASTSLLQRRFRIGYTRAARIMDTMEEDGIIGPPTGTSKAREVLPYTHSESGEDFSKVEDPAT
ncbi:MAG: DNA translocase FtsK [Anaerolineae bacterium]|nr:MAG: DNA translocase FtsK [Anaerolineae bacterium]